MSPSKPKAQALNLNDIQDHPIGGPDQPDSETKKESADLERQEKEAHIHGLRQDIQERKTYAERIFWLLSIWLTGIFFLLVLQGALSPWNIFNLDKSILLAAIGGTTINIIGIFIVVARYLFPQRQR